MNARHQVAVGAVMIGSFLAGAVSVILLRSTPVPPSDPQPSLSPDSWFGSVVEQLSIISDAQRLESVDARLWSLLEELIAVGGPQARVPPRLLSADMWPAPWLVRDGFMETTVTAVAAGDWQPSLLVVDVVTWNVVCMPFTATVHETGIVGYHAKFLITPDGRLAELFAVPFRQSVQADLAPHANSREELEGANREAPARSDDATNERFFGARYLVIGFDKTWMERLEPQATPRRRSRHRDVAGSTGR